MSPTLPWRRAPGPDPAYPSRPAAARIAWRPAYRVANRLERRRFRARYPAAAAAADNPAVASLLRSSGRLRVVVRVPGINRRKAYRRNADLVLDLCERRAISYFVVPEPESGQWRIGIAEEAWDEFVSALVGAAADRPLYVGVRARTRSGIARRWPELVEDRRIRAAMAVQRELEVFECVRGLRGRVLDRPYACLVDRWERADDGALVAPSRNAVTTYVGPAFQDPVSIPTGGSWVTTLAPMASRHMFDIDFPVDVVYTWVDGSDTAWQARKATALGDLDESSPPHDDAVSDTRFRDLGELRFSLRSVERHAPWVRRIFLVTDKQVPEWLDTSGDRLVLIDHEELFDGVGRLPTFNSHAIGARLHHIGGLSEHYLHFNDDFFLGRDVDPSLFFLSNGMSRFFLSRSTLAFRDPGTALPHEQARRNVVDLLARDFGRSPTRVFFHTPIAQQRSVMFELENRYPEEFRRTWSSQFRSGADIEPNSWMHHYYAYLTGRSVPGQISYDYFALDAPGTARRMQRVARTRDRDTFCINDSDEATDRQRDRAVVWLRRYFRGPSSFELPAPAERDPASVPHPG